jgi:hypothetical protein
MFQEELNHVKLYYGGCTQTNTLSALSDDAYWAKHHYINGHNEFRGTYKISWKTFMRPTPGPILEVIDSRNNVVWTRRIMATPNAIGLERGEFNFIVGGNIAKFILYDVRTMSPCGYYPKPHAQLHALLEFEKI